MKKKQPYMKSVGLVLCTALVSTAFVCTNNQQQKAAKFADTYAQSLKAAHDAVDSAFVSGHISTQEKQAFYSSLVRANEAGLHLNAAIRAVANSAGTVAEIHAAIAEAQRAVDDGTAAISNPTTKAEVHAALSSGVTVLGMIENLYPQHGGGK